MTVWYVRFCALLGQRDGEKPCSSCYQSPDHPFLPGPTAAALSLFKHSNCPHFTVDLHWVLYCVLCWMDYARRFLCNISRKQANKEVCILKCIAAWQPGGQKDIFLFQYLWPEGRTHQDTVCNVVQQFTVCGLEEGKVMELLHLQDATKKVCTGDIWTQISSHTEAFVWVKEWLWKERV